MFISKAAGEVSFSQLAVKSSCIARALQKFGIGKGDVIAVLLPNCMEIIETYIAAGAIGASFQPLDFRFQGEELKSALINTAVKMLISHTSAVTEGLESVVPASVQKIMVGGQRPGWAGYEEIFAGAADEMAPPAVNEEKDIALFLYSSGSTSEIKCIPMTFRQLDFFPDDLACFWDLSVIQRGISLLPLSHISGAVITNTCLKFGVSYVITVRFTPASILELMARHHVTWTHTVPSIAGLLLRGNPEKYDLSHMKMIALMGTSVPVSLLKDLERVIPSVQAIQGYGLTETSPLLTLEPPRDDAKKIGTIGKALLGVDIRLVDENGKAVPVNEPGELIVRGQKVLSGYYGNPKLTERVFNDGWFYTKDVAKCDADGFFYHLGRLDDLIITGGLNVFPAEVEAAAIQYPKVKEAVAYAIPDASRGQVIGMDVCPCEGCDIVPGELKRFLQSRLASYKIPMKIHLVDGISHTPTGKPIRKPKETDV